MLHFYRNVALFICVLLFIDLCCHVVAFPTRDGEQLQPPAGAAQRQQQGEDGLSAALNLGSSLPYLIRSSSKPTVEGQNNLPKLDGQGSGDSRSSSSPGVQPRVDDKNPYGNPYIRMENLARPSFLLGIGHGRLIDKEQVPVMNLELNHQIPLMSDQIHTFK